MGKLRPNGPGRIGLVIVRREVIDETCFCGHSIKRHAGVAGARPGFDVTRGKCCVRGCDCQRYRFWDFVF